MDTHATVWRSLSIAVLLGAATVGGLVAELWSTPTDIGTWVIAVLAFVGFLLAGRARRLLERTRAASEPVGSHD